MNKLEIKKQIKKNIETKSDNMSEKAISFISELMKNSLTHMTIKIQKPKNNEINNCTFIDLVFSISEPRYEKIPAINSNIIDDNFYNVNLALKVK
ncbi:hypothetical protein LU293_09760 [Moraxella nasovis]|uniref:hypothetical protein n=1 Tax=Moraxella nasovis TaxID=2904121 RepID=UPI001F60611E|nr:hypothetical protein [Moraxella nasovis]UNU73332.1 hypothetical protein LU293_09760 [Moraxella nasovis]